MYVLTPNESFFVEVHLSGKYGKLCKCAAIILKFGKPAIMGHDVLNTKRCTRMHIIHYCRKKEQPTMLELSVFDPT